MITFLVCWGLALATLAASVTLLGLVYRWKGSDLGLKPWPNELALALFTSACQAGLFWVFAVLGTGGHWLIFILGAMIAYLSYKLAHPREMEHTEPILIGFVQVVLNIAAALGIGALLR